MWRCHSATFLFPVLFNVKGRICGAMDFRMLILEMPLLCFRLEDWRICDPLLAVVAQEVNALVRLQQFSE